MTQTLGGLCMEVVEFGFELCDLVGMILCELIKRLLGGRECSFEQTA
jgi:hypothetical protein